jgi:uncharacterized peroxidase-related enzyme
MESYFKLTQENQADDKTELIYNSIKEKFQITFIPSFFKAIAPNEKLINGIWNGYERLLIDGIIPKEIKEMIFLTVAINKGCNYCSSTHLAVCDMLDVSKENISSILSDLDEVCPTRVRLILNFSLDLITKPKEITKEHYDRLNEYGVTNEEIIDIIGITILSNTAVNIAQSMGLSVEKEIVDYLKGENLNTGLESKVAA